MPKIVKRSRQDDIEKIGKKLLEIRLKFNESQNGMLKKLGLENDFRREYVSKWEHGLLMPPLYVLCAYADFANIFLEVIVRDDLFLPESLPVVINNKSKILKQE